MSAPASPATPASAPDAHSAPDGLTPLDLTTPQLTVRAVLTGVLLGSVLSACNIHTGLTIGWGLNMSFLAVLLSYAFWQALHRGLGTRPWTLQENNINQTACSAGAAVSSAGLVAPIPALTMLTGQELEWLPMALWVASVCLVGISVAIPLRRQMIVVDKLPFPSGMANGELLREMYAKGSEAAARITAMSIAIGLSAGLTLVRLYPVVLHTLLAPVGWFSAIKVEAWRIATVAVPIPTSWLRGFRAENLTFAFDPSLLLFAVGGLIGFRACVSLVLGAIFAWLVVAPWLIHEGAMRLTHQEPLVQLSAEIDPSVAFPPPPQGFMQYRADQGVLEFRGVMTPTLRDQKLALSDNPRFQASIRKTFVNSQLRIAAPLERLPAEAALRDLPVQYDVAKRELYVVAGVDRASLAQLRTLSSSADYQRALDALAAPFDYTTTASIQFSEPAAPLPSERFIVPRLWAATVRVDRDRERVVLLGVLPAAGRDAILDAAGAHEREHPDDAEGVAAFRAALGRLQARAAAPLGPSLSPGSPALRALQDVVQISDADKTVVFRGVMTQADFDALEALVPADPSAAPASGPAVGPARDDWRATLADVRRSSAWRPVAPNFRDGVDWLLWPGVTLMVVSSLVSFAFSWPAMLRALRGKRSGPTPSRGGDMPALFAVPFMIFALAAATACQYFYFGIPIWLGVLAVLLTFALALVAARVTGETNTNPVGAMGKVTQLIFGVLQPGAPATNLMSANITGGAASQCGDLMHDLKTGSMLGSTPWKQSVAQICGALGGSFAGAAFYLTMVPDPARQLMTTQYPAPAVATWKAVAELFKVGLEALPAGAATAMVIAAVVGVLLPILDRYAPARMKVLVPSASAIGLAFVIPGQNALSMFLGGALALLVTSISKSWAARFVVAICAGLVAGESLTLVADVFAKLIGSHALG